jgi:hypothetical protein
MLNRPARKAPPTLTFTSLAIDLLTRFAHPSPRSQSRPPTLNLCHTQFAQLGGYLARAGDAPPGNMVIWRGLVGSDIEIGFLLGSQQVGK